MLARTLTIFAMSVGSPTLAFVSSQEAGTAEAPAISVRPAVGVRIPYTLKLNSSTKLKHGVETFDSATVAEQSFELEALETSDKGTTRFAIHFGRAKGAAKSGGSSDPFDSEKPSKGFHVILDGDAIAQGMLRRAGKTVHATVTAQGRVEKVEGLAELYKGLEDFEEIPVEHEIQELFPLLPGEPITARTKWAGAYSFTPSENETVEFLPDCSATQVSADAVTWSIKTPAIGSPASKSKPPPSDGKAKRVRGSTSGKNWRSESWTVQAAAVSGSTQVAQADGLLRRNSIEWAFDLLYGELETDSKTFSNAVRREVEIVRR